MNTTDGTQPKTDHTELDRATTAAETHLSRADAKASALLAISGAALTVQMAAAIRAEHLPVLALAFGAVALTATAGAIVVLIDAIRPRLGGGHGLTVWATGLYTDPDPTWRLAWTARAALAKYRRIAIAAWLLLTALTAALTALSTAIAIR
jgi:hypothetical protein